MINDDVVTSLGLKRYPLPREEDNLCSLTNDPLSCKEYVKIRVTAGNGSGNDEASKRAAEEEMRRSVLARILDHEARERRTHI